MSFIIIFVCCVVFSLAAGMEDLTRSWQKLSLTNKEGVNVDLTESRKVHGFALAAKFFTRRSLNIDAVVRTFRPLWCTKGSFQVSDAKQNFMVFTFDLEEDVEKVLMGEPWSFHKHLVVFRRYDGATPVQEISFDWVSFWVQIHHLPFSLLMEEVLSSWETHLVMS